MLDFIDLGVAPPGEPFLAEDVEDKTRAARKYVAAIRAKLGMEPSHASLLYRGMSDVPDPRLHVLCYFDDTDDCAVDYAFLCALVGPTTWHDTVPPAPHRYTVTLNLTVRLPVEAIHPDIADVLATRRLRQSVEACGGKPGDVQVSAVTW